MLASSSKAHASSGSTAEPAVNYIGIFTVTIVITLVHLVTNGRYGFHRDELQVLSDALHLEWGYVVYPPLTPFVERVGMSIFGLSLVGLRLFSVIAQATVIIFSGLMARELGGGRLAQFATALSVALAPLALFEGTEFQYTSFDYLWWVLLAYFVVRLLKSEDPRWCLAIGTVAGLGMLTKYTMAFFVIGVVGGALLTRARRYLLSRWFWAGIALAFLIFLPNLVWQVRHDFISIHFLQHIHARDVSQGRANGFWLQQLWVCTNSVAVLLWIVGLIAFFRNPRYRMLAWMYLIPALILWLSKGRGYYAGALYPMLIAMGATVLEQSLNRMSSPWRSSIAATYLILLTALGVLISTIVIPLASSGPLRDRALKANGDLREEIGWNDLVKTIAGIRDSLPPEKRDKVGIVVGNYGEQGAIEILGKAYGLPRPISGTNSAWYRGYPTPPPSILIVIGHSQSYVDRTFTGCRLVAHNTNHLGVRNEESVDHPDIFLCGPPRQPWPEFWKDYQSFG
jgi:4-amino-4-deoxy-L-arabinose transferase-like glycosyltransferase